MLSAIHADEVSFVFCADMKMNNIVLDLQNHASSHPCCYCDVSKDHLDTCGNLRTFGSLKQNHLDFVQSSSKKAKHFCNVVNVSLIDGPDDSHVLDVVPPCELHILLGVTNKLYSELEKVYEKASA